MGILDRNYTDEDARAIVRNGNKRYFSGPWFRILFLFQNLKMNKASRCAGKYLAKFSIKGTMTMLFSGIVKGAVSLHFIPCAQKMDKLFNKKSQFVDVFIRKMCDTLQVDIGKALKFLAYTRGARVLGVKNQENTWRRAYLAKLTPKFQSLRVYQLYYTSRKIAEGSDEVMGWCVEALR